MNKWPAFVLLHIQQPHVAPSLPLTYHAKELLHTLTLSAEGRFTRIMFAVGGKGLLGGPAGYRERLLAKNFESFYSHSGQKFL